MLIVRAFWVQIANQDFYISEGQKRYQHAIALSPTRGRIIDRNGALLAVSLTSYEIWANPKKISKADYPLLAKALGLPIVDLEQRLAGDRSFALLKRQADADTVKAIDDLEIDGITRTPDSKRVYPEGEPIAHVIGFTNIAGEGQEGVEFAANALLSGVAGKRTVIRDRLGRAVDDDRPLVSARAGTTVELTIDRRIQEIAFEQVKAAVGVNNAQAGSVVVLDARNGEILALANYPAFDPNNRSMLSGPRLRNRALVDSFEPGSTIKPLVIALALDAGVAKAQTVIDTSPGTYKIGTATIHDTSNHGSLTVAEALQKSSNIALAKLSQKFPAEVIWNKYQEYGIGQAPKLLFPGIAPGRVRPYQRWMPIEQATMAYGYGLSMSLLQIAQLYTAYATDGTLHPASLVRNPAQRQAVTEHPGHRVTTAATAAAIRTMLESAAGQGGTGRSASVEGYRIGGKTGTVRKQVGVSYAKGRYRALFVGMAPMSFPRLIVAVMIDEPKSRGYYGGPVAGPVFSSVVGASLSLLGVAPDARLLAQPQAR